MADNQETASADRVSAGQNMVRFINQHGLEMAFKVLAGKLEEKAIYADDPREDTLFWDMVFETNAIKEFCIERIADLEFEVERLKEDNYALRYE